MSLLYHCNNLGCWLDVSTTWEFAQLLDWGRWDGPAYPVKLILLPALIMEGEDGKYYECFIYLHKFNSKVSLLSEVRIPALELVLWFLKEIFPKEGSLLRTSAVLLNQMGTSVLPILGHQQFARSVFNNSFTDFLTLNICEGFYQLVLD